MLLRLCGTLLLFLQVRTVPCIDSGKALWYPVLILSDIIVFISVNVQCKIVHTILMYHYYGITVLTLLLLLLLLKRVYG